MFFFGVAIAASFLLGLSVGSFLNSVIFRLETGEGLAFSGGKAARSYCRSCGRVLRWFELIPVVSFLGLKGRCRTCRVKLSWQYPVVELLTGVLFALVVWQVFAPVWQARAFAVPDVNLEQLLAVVFSFYVVAVLIVVSVYDLRHYLIPDVVIWPALLFAVVYNGVGDLTAFVGSPEGALAASDFSRTFGGLGAGLGAAAFFWAIVVVSRGRWLGLGDVKLVLFMGLVLGWPRILPALVLAFWMGAIGGGILLATHRKQLSSPVPFGPSLALGTIAVLLFGAIASEHWWVVRFLFS